MPIPLWSAEMSCKSTWLGLRLGRLCLVLAGLVLGVAGAPASCPGQFRGAWLPAEPTIVAQVSVSHAANDRWFCGEDRGHCAAGERDVLSDLTSSERARSTSTSLHMELAPGHGFSVMADLPFHVLDYKRYINTYTAPVDNLRSDGVGDLRLAVRAGLTRGAWAVSGGYGIEFPTGEFTVSAFVVPIGQGTRNHEVFLEAGRSLYPLPAYVETGILYRAREAFVTDTGVEIYWGDEMHARLGGGWQPRPSWWVKLEARGFKSGERTSNIPGEPPGEFRSAWELVPGILWETGDVGWDLWVRFPVAGRNTPADPSLGLAASYRFAFPGWAGAGRGGTS